MRAYIATMNIDHDGVRYVPGAEIRLDDNCAGRLLRAGAIEQARQDKAAKSPKPAAKTPAADGKGNPSDPPADEGGA